MPATAAVGTGFWCNAIKRRCASMAGFKSFDYAAITIAGMELAHYS